MARFDVYRLADTYVLDCQSEVLGQLDTRFVVPLLPVDTVPHIQRLNPIFQNGEERMVMATQLAFPVRSAQMRGRIASLADEHDRIINAFDMLLTGY